MLDPEYYVSQYRLPNGSWETTSYRDTLDETLPPIGFHHNQDDGSSTSLAERRPVLIIPVPNENSWASPSFTLPPSFTANNNNNDADDEGAARSKRVREEDGDADKTMTAKAEEDANPSNNNNTNNNTSKTPKTVKEGGNNSSTTTTTNDASITSPPPGACMVYLYDTESSSSIRLNDIVEVIGVLSKVPELATPHMMNGCGNDTLVGGVESMLEEEVLASHLPTSLVPRIHAITTSSSSSNYNTTTDVISNDVSAARGRIMGILTTILSGDELAAEYVLLQLVARVHMRTGGASGGGGGAAVGVPSLNLVDAPAATNSSEASSTTSLSNLGAALNAVLQALTPRSMALPLKVDTLNAKPWWPRRHGGTLRLMTGPLQLAPGTQILLDETVMQSGRLNEVGLRNLSAVQSIIKAQCVGYDFEYFSLDQPTDAPVTVLSTGRSLLKSSVDTVVPLRPYPSQQGDDDATSFSSLLLESDTSSHLNDVRRYLSAVRGLDLKIDGDVSQFIEGDLAGARQKDARVGEETFHKWLTVARLMAVSWGEGELTGERWRAAMEMEKSRMIRTGELKC
jgi:hypothetical protein